MSHPIHTPTIGYFDTDPCGVTTVSTVTLTPTLDTCAGNGLTYSAAFTLSGSLGANETLEMWSKFWLDSDSEPALTYDSALGRFTTSPQTGLKIDRPLLGSDDGAPWDHSAHAIVEIRVVPISATPGAGPTCDSLASSQSDTDANDCFA